MYEFIKTKDGWRVFWGIDPSSEQPQPTQEGQEGSPQEADVLPFPAPEQEPETRPAA